MTPCQYEITDDSGFLGLVDPSSYRSFVDANWTLDQLVRHFKAEIKEQRLAIWGTGREGIWRVEVRFCRSSESGFREHTTLLRASAGHFLLANYETLTMAAQFEDVQLPEAHDITSLISLAPGLYSCRIVQRFDPESVATLRDNGADFIIELCLAEGIVTSEEWPSGIPWSTL